MTDNRIPFPIYHLDFSVTRGRVSALLNGFPVAELHADERRGISVPINPYLVGANNELRVVVHGLDPAAGVEAAVRRFTKGRAIRPDSGTTITRITANPAERVVHGSWKLRATFSSLDAPSFEDELMASEPWMDYRALSKYAMHLRQLIQDERADALLEELRPKIEAHACAFAEDPEAMTEEIGRFIVDELLTTEPRMEFTADDLMCVPHCGGRLWSIERRGCRPLLDEDDSQPPRSRLRVFVARREGRLRIVR